MLKLFVGYDKQESVAYHVFCHSILRRSSIPVSITPLNRDCLRGFFSRERGKLDSTDFAITRFLVPFICDYQGFAVFMDGDMLCLGDVAELSGYMTLMDKYGTAVRVVKHRYEPTEKTKFLGNVQTKYPMKNWSSVMIFNNTLCRTLTPQFVEQASGLDLHQFQWCQSRQIGDLPAKWNHLVGISESTEDVKLLHYTNGTPCFPEYADCDFSELWKAEYQEMISHGS